MNDSPSAVEERTIRSKASCMADDLAYFVEAFPDAFDGGDRHAVNFIRNIFDQINQGHFSLVKVAR